jgi:hypothetical protein
VRWLRSWRCNLDAIRNQQANDILEAMERLVASGHVFTIVTDRSSHTQDGKVVIRAARFDDETIHVAARKATLRDALAHLIQIFEV